MLEDPRINFAISTRGNNPEVDHLGFQTDTDEELAELKARAQAADLTLLDEGEVSCCCSARSEKPLGDGSAGHRLGAFPDTGEHSATLFSEKSKVADGDALRPNRAAQPRQRLHSCAVALPALDKPPAAEAGVADKTYNVLFICTGNSARSIVAEALMNHAGPGPLQAPIPAGSHPTGNRQSPSARSLLRGMGVPVNAGAQQESGDEFAAPWAPAMDPSSSRSATAPLAKSVRSLAWHLGDGALGACPIPQRCAAARRSNAWPFGTRLSP